MSIIVGETGGDALDEGVIGLWIISGGGAVEESESVPDPASSWWKIFVLSVWSVAPCVMDAGGGFGM